MTATRNAESEAGGEPEDSEQLAEFRFRFQSQFRRRNHRIAEGLRAPFCGFTEILPHLRAGLRRYEHCQRSPDG